MVDLVLEMLSGQQITLSLSTIGFSNWTKTFTMVSRGTGSEQKVLYNYRHSLRRLDWELEEDLTLKKLLVGGVMLE